MFNIRFVNFVNKLQGCYIYRSIFDMLINFSRQILITVKYESARTSQDRKTVKSLSDCINRVAKLMLGL